MVYYNEFDPYTAQWLENLIEAGYLPPGDVDRRDIREVQANDLREYRQAHFFAGIGGWPYALQLACWPKERSVWTGSPPCQDVSNAGASWGVRCGLDGDRTSMVRVWLDLAERLRPGSLYFENVPGIKPWLAEIKNRLAGLGYQVSERKRSTADIGGPHLRRRIFLAAHLDGARFQKPRLAGPQTPFSDPRRTPPGDFWVAAPHRSVGMADGFPRRVDALRALGNAIDPWVAAEFVSDDMKAAPSCKRIED